MLKIKAKLTVAIVTSGAARCASARGVGAAATQWSHLNAAEGAPGASPNLSEIKAKDVVPRQAPTSGLQH